IGVQMKPGFGAADHRARRQSQQSGGFVFDEPLEPIPNRGWSFAQLGERIEGEIEDDQRQIAVAQQKVRGFERFGGLLTTDPEQARKTKIESGGIERIAAVDKANPLRLRMTQNGANDQRATGGSYVAAKIRNSASSHDRA